MLLGVAQGLVFGVCDVYLGLEALTGRQHGAVVAVKCPVLSGQGQAAINRASVIQHCFSLLSYSVSLVSAAKRKRYVMYAFSMLSLS